jgi:hypothetical protein
VIRFELRFFGNIIQGGKDISLIIANLNDPDRFKHYGGSTILEDGVEVDDREFQNNLRLFINNINALSEDVKEMIIELFP